MASIFTSLLLACVIAYAFALDLNSLLGSFFGTLATIALFFVTFRYSHKFLQHLKEDA